MRSIRSEDGDGGAQQLLRIRLEAGEGEKSRAELPPERRHRIDARYHELKQKIEGLRELREIAGKAQLEVAAALHIKQPSVSKIEKQADMYLSTLRSYVEAIGGKLELIVKLPSRPALRLGHLGDVALDQPSARTMVRRRTGTRP